MSVFTKTLIYCLMLLLSFTANAKSTSDQHDEMVNKTMTQFMQENKLPGMAVELYVNGKHRSYYFGYANREKKTRVNKNTIFEVGSITKIMTALLLAQQVDTAKVQLNDPIKKYFARLSDGLEDITLQNLATHTSGLPFDAPDKIASSSQLENFLDHYDPKVDPDDKWIYSNLGIGMLGLTMEQITHKSLKQLYQANILSPLKMHDFAFIIPQRFKSYAAQGYDENNKPITTSKLGLFPSAWAIKASSLDMQHFLAAAIGLPGTPERILYPIRMTQAAYVKLPDSMQGLGWDIHPITSDNIEELLDSNTDIFAKITINEIYDKPKFDGDALIDKTGITDGFNSYIALIPNKKSGIVVLTNGYVDINQLVNKTREVLFKLNGISKETT